MGIRIHAFSYSFHQIIAKRIPGRGDMYDEEIKRKREGNPRRRQRKTIKCGLCITENPEQKLRVTPGEILERPVKRKKEKKRRREKNTHTHLAD